MRKTFLFSLFLLLFLSLFISCDDFMENVLDVGSSSSSRRGGETTSVITVTADAVGKLYSTGTPNPDPAFTYTFSPDPLPKGVSLTGALTRDAGEVAGTYVIRQGTLELSGANAGKYTLRFIGNIFSIYNN